MKNFHQIKKEVRSILIAFIILGISAFAVLSFVFYQINVMHGITVDIYNHPLKVSNAALAMRSEILRIRINMHYLTMPSLQKENPFFIKDIDEHEEHIYQNLSVIEKNILADDGKKLQEKTKEIIQAWKPMRDEVITLVNNNEMNNAITFTKNKMEEHVSKLEIAVSEIYEHAQNKAISLKNESEKTYEQLEFMKFLMIGALLFVFIFIAYYTIIRISKYINKNVHLSGILSVIRAVNQLIVREKDKQKLIQESCNILASKHVFADAWIVLFKGNNQIEYIAGTDKQKDFTQFKEKIQSGWKPHCVTNTIKENNSYSFIEKTKENCYKCPLMDLYSGKSAFNIALKHNEKVFGYLTLSLDKNHVEYTDELELLKEVSGDIAYALNTIDVNNNIVYLKELYANTINSLANLLFVKDTDFIYIVCNKAFEEFVGKSHDEIIGKSDYDVFDKDVADFFREHDKKMLADKIPKSNFEWVRYPDGKRVYLLTVKSPLLNSAGDLIGLVGNSVDITKQKEIEISLLESEEHFKLLMKESPSVIEVYDLEGLQIDVNHAYEELWGIPASLTLNKFNLFKSEEVARTGLMEYVKRAYAGEAVDVPLYTFDSGGSTEAQGQGRVRTLNTNIYPLKNLSGDVKNIVIMHEDVTDRENTLLQLEQKKKELESIIQEAPNPIIINNTDGKVISINKAWTNLSGYSLDEIPTVDIWVDKVYEENAREKVKNLIYSLADITSKIDLGEFTFSNKNKEFVTWQFSAAPLGMIDGKRTIITSAMDITELKKKDELMIAQSRHAAMGEMIGMIAHQWRQPLSVISMIANNMLLDIGFESLKTDEVEKYSQDILKQTQHLSETIDDFRNFFKPEKEISKVKLQDVMNNTYSMIKESLVNNNIEFKILNNSESEVDAYPRELMQVFVNIINNAKDVLLLNKIKSPFVEVTIDEDEKYINTKICDNGGGIQDDVIKKVFDPYFTTKDEKNGTGLGLYMSKIIIEEHLHGSLQAVNTDKGVCFNIGLLKSKDLKNAE